MPLDVFGALNHKFSKRNEVTIDNSVFKLHYRATVLLLVACSLLVTSRQYFGTPINCMTASSLVPNDVLDNYCWISTTFTLTRSMNKKVGSEVPFPGIDRSTTDEERTYHQYYQWVCFALFLQAIMFYVPHYLWKIWEGGRLKSLADGLQLATVSENELEGKKEVILVYFARNLHQHNFYFGRYVVCEALNVVNAIGQIYFTNRFLGGAFTNYGVEVIKYSETIDQSNRTDPMVLVFPRITKCLFHTFGPSGDVQKHDAMCVLPINIINEKIYIFLWFWFLILVTLSSIAVVYRLATVASPTIRYLLLRIRSRCAPREFVQSLNQKLQAGDWFFLYQLGKTIDARSFDRIMTELAKKLKGELTPDSNSTCTSI